ncbi:MAG: beta-propeller domain-containing protein [Patescibacteria group bacterium]
MQETRNDSGGGKSPVTIGAVLAFVLTIAVLGAAIYLWLLGSSEPTQPIINSNQPGEPLELDEDFGEIERFITAEDFSAWLTAADAKSESVYGMKSFAGRGVMMESMAVDSVMAPTSVPSVGEESNGVASGSSAERVSGTNVQVVGIDEPDILKTDGKEIYYSPQSNYYPMFRGVVEPAFDQVVSSEEMKIAPGFVPPEYRVPAIKAVKAFPPADLAVDAEIARTGDMLLHGSRLAVFTYEGVFAYDVTDPTKPAEAWKISYENGSYPVAQRLMDDQLYLVVANGIDRGRPCPYVPLAVDGREVAIACDAIWHPVYPTPAELTYTILKVDLITGETAETVSFVGSYSSTVYMSAENIYVTHQYQPETFKFIVGFVNENSDLVPGSVRERLNKISSYDISEQSKMNELSEALSRWLNSVNEDDALMLANEIENRVGSYAERHRREVQSTGIVRISIDDLSVDATGSVPGAPLNQFSLDEFAGHLRVATTTGDMSGWFWQFGFGGQIDSVNDVYVLDMNLKEVGAALGMGLDERIYAVRFIGERGYVVTFRETDPFYVLDLSNPSKPEVKGELKIPGYSSYLHPVRENLILGVGQEDNQVKLSLFDVSDPSNPVEVSKYSLKEYWTDVQNTHHAFLLDDKFEVFFIPGGNGGYIFSYANDELTLTKAVSVTNAKRALFLDDYLYVVGDEGIVVLDEKDWSRVNELMFE